MTMAASHPGLPDSNADAVAKRLALMALDLDGDGLVRVMQLLLHHAEEIRRMHQRAAQFDREAAADRAVDAGVVRGTYLEALYDPVCIEWLLSRVMKELAEQFELRMYESQQRLRPLERITYTDSGQVDHYRLTPPKPSEGD
jgi:hypothetical protein